MKITPEDPGTIYSQQNTKKRYQTLKTYEKKLRQENMIQSLKQNMKKQETTSISWEELVENLRKRQEALDNLKEIL